MKNRLSVLHFNNLIVDFSHYPILYKKLLDYCGKYADIFSQPIVDAPFEILVGVYESFLWDEYEIITNSYVKDQTGHVFIMKINKLIIEETIESCDYWTTRKYAIRMAIKSIDVNLEEN